MTQVIMDKYIGVKSIEIEWVKVFVSPKLWFGDQTTQNRRFVEFYLEYPGLK